MEPAADWNVALDEALQAYTTDARPPVGASTYVGSDRLHIPAKVVGQALLVYLRELPTPTRSKDHDS